MSPEKQRSSRIHHRAFSSQLALAAALFFTIPLARAQDAFADRLQSLRTRQPVGVSLRIWTAKSEFFVGEQIPLELSFSAAEPAQFLADTRLQDRIGRMNGLEEFLVDPISAGEDPLRGLPGEAGGMGGLSGGDIALSAKPFTFTRVLNEWVRLRSPGYYRIAVLSRRVHRAGTPAQPLELVSNVLDLHIAPAPPEWVKSQISEAVKTLDAPAEPSEESRKLRASAGRTLRFLESPEAAMQLANHLDSGEGVESWALHMGVLGSHYRGQLLPLLEARLIAPDQPVWPRYLDTVARLAELVESGGPAKSYPSETGLQAVWRDQQRLRQEVYERHRKRLAARLIASLPAKQPEALATSIDTLTQTAGRDGQTKLAWLPPLLPVLAAGFPRLPATLQSQLLNFRWTVIRSPAMLPVLRGIVEHPPWPRVDPPLQEIALRRLYELAPVEGRRRILAEIANPNTLISVRTLKVLPDRSLPDLNETLAARLEAGQHVDDLIVRYATGDIVKRVEAVYRKREEEMDLRKLPHCGSSLLAYFLQHDPPFGEVELRRDIQRGAEFRNCYSVAFRFFGQDEQAYSPALERLAIEYLGSREVPVKRNAAELLGKYGSPAAQKPLWHTLEFFHSWWKGREEQLNQPGGQEGLQFERTLRVALAQAGNWVLQKDDLARLLALCSTAFCRQEVTQWIAGETEPILIRSLPKPEGKFYLIAQYEAASEAQLRRRLLQFPSGTRFRISSYDPDDLQTQNHIAEIIRDAGFKQEFDR